MGNYNPHNPEILGMEWVPIAERLRILDIDTEIGYSFAVTGAPNTSLDQINLLTNPPEQSLAGSTIFYSVYPRGREDDTGEINVVRMVPSSVSVTGVTVQGGGVAVDALTYAGDATYLQFDATTDQIRVNFNVPSYFQGKRILRVELIYTTFGTPGYALFPTLETNTVVYPYGTFTGPATLAEAQQENLSFGEVNPWWALLGGVGPNTNSSRFPFRYDELLLLQTTLFVGIKVNNLPLSGVANLSFLGIDVYYCEESRVRYGGQAIGQDPTGNLSLATPGSTYTIPIRTPSFATSGTMAAGDYTVTVTQADAGDLYNTSGIGVPELTQLYEIPSHPGVQVTKFKTPVPPQPLLPPTAEPTDQIVACGLTGTGGTINLQAGEAAITYCDLYGAPVYVNASGTSITATQGIHNEATPADTTYEWVRFYARRFNPLAPGDLTVTVSGSGSATITPAEFALLDEITQGEYGPGTGWKEVTLPITAVFSSDGTFRNVVFSMTGVAVGNPIDQWQLITPGVTLPPEYINFTSYGSSRYDGLQNADSMLKTPISAGVVTSSQYTISTMFSQAPMAVTGFALDTCTIEVSGIGEGCAGVPECIPTHILGNRMSWGSSVICENFDDRTLTDEWGNASETGQPWVNTNSPDTAFDVADGSGQHTLETAAVRAISTIGDGTPIDDGVMLFKVKATVTATGASYETAGAFRKTSDTAYYYAHPRFETNGTITARISEFDGAAVNLASASNMGTYTAGDEFYVKIRWFGTTIQLKFWHVEVDEPLEYMLFFVGDTTHTTGSVALVSTTAGGNTNVPFTIYYDEFQAMHLSLEDGFYEIQRRDDLDEDFQQIAMLDVCNTAFCDYEARVGMESEYRIRSVNPLDFTSAWVTGTGFLASPGVSGAADGNSVLIFTSNQDPDASLAYVMQFEGDAVEEFNFPEAGQVSMRTQYQKNYFTAFHGTERGGEVFTREILVQAAAIPPISMGDFNNLRDLGWADLPYVCVRDELGNRWLANVAVPTGRVRLDRTIYIAQVQITEVTDIPAPVDESI